jgi:ribosome-associated protein
MGCKCETGWLCALFGLILANFVHTQPQFVKQSAIPRATTAQTSHHNPGQPTTYDTLNGMEPIDVSIRDESIRLGQFLKLANLVETGGLAKELIAEGQVQVNGEVDTRRGKVLHPGDVVSVGDMAARVASADEDDDDYFDEATADDDFDPEKWRNL